ncbi:MAG: isopentenyl-diphosphate Delta-isomerase [Lentihominibacter sp.]
MENQLILVDEQDRETGFCEKLEAHKKGLLHRAFSVFIFRRVLVDNPDGTRTFRNQLLIQKRAAGKYHSAGLWANSCCSHPGKGEETEAAAVRRLAEETGIEVSALEGFSESCSGLEEKGSFIYKAEFDNGLTEYEFDHVFTGWLPGDGLPYSDSQDGQSGSYSLNFNREEAEDMKFADVEQVMRDVMLNPADYAAWFMPALLIATEGTEFGSLNPEASCRLIY